MMASAQDENLNKEIVVEKDYTPIEQKASKLSLVPPVVQFEPSASNLTFSMQNSPVATGNDISTLPAYGYLTKFVDNDPRGYLNFSMGSYLNINTSAGFKIIDSKKSKLAVFVNHLSAGGVKSNLFELNNAHSKPAQPYKAQEINRKWNEEYAGVNFSQIIGTNILNCEATYNYSNTSVFNNTDNDYISPQFSQFYIRKFGTNVTGNDVDVKLGIKSISDNSITYNANITVNYYDYAAKYKTTYSSKQTYLKFDGGISDRLLNKYKVGLNITGEYMNTNRPESEIGLVRFIPYFAKPEGALKYSLGLNFDVNINNGKAINISPEVNASYEFIKGLSIYGTATGGKHFNRMYDLSQEFRYTLMRGMSNSSMTQVDAKVGVVMNPIKGFSMRVYGGYENIKNLNMPLLSMVDLDIFPWSYNQTSTQDIRFWFKFRDPSYFYQLNASGFMWGAEIDYTYSGFGDIHLGVKNAKQNNTGSNYCLGYDRPEWIVDAQIGVNPINKLRIVFGYEWRGKRLAGPFQELSYQENDYVTLFSLPSTRHSIIGPSMECYDFKDVSNLWMQAEYKVTDFLSVNLQATNLLNKKWQIADNYRNQGIAVMGGISLRFK